MAWWDINLHTGDGGGGFLNQLQKTVDPFKGLLTSLNPFHKVGNNPVGVLQNLLIPTWGSNGGQWNWSSILSSALDPSGIVSNQLLPNQGANNAAAAAATTSEVTEPALSEPTAETDPNSSEYQAGITLRRRKSQNALRYGFMSTLSKRGLIQKPKYDVSIPTRNFPGRVIPGGSGGKKNGG